ncbi:MAG: hypothetical protein H0X72_15875 [Acidobacteria bacterium]|jgi:hypothetical protein|nr:hypothetical protein [Acidobacteriota bacterium]
MSRFKVVFSSYLIIGFMIFGFAAQAGAQGIRNERNVRDITRSLNSKVDDFKYSLDNESSRNAISRDEQTEINGNLRDFETSLGKFEDKFQRRRENADDVRDVLSAAKRVNDFLIGKRLAATAEKDWASIRTLLKRLASNYQVAWNWNDGNQTYPNDNTNPNNYPATRSNSSNSYGLTGTYKLNASRSEDARDIADRAIRDGNVQNNPNAQSDLENKLQSPEQVIIEVRGSSVTLASSNAPQITFTADGRDRTEKLADGRTLRLRSTLRGQELTVASLGGDTDYTVIFASIEGGKTMRVTRRVTTNYLRQTVFAESIYEKTDSVARFDNNPNYNDDGTYSSNDSQDNRNTSSNNYPTTRTGRTGDFIVPNGTILTGVLEKNIDTKVSQNNDRFELVVQSPNEYRGAIIEGYISGVNRSGKVSGNSQITFNFERIRLSNGQTYDFAGFLQSATDENGKLVKIDAEGTAKGNSQTKETVKRGGIGAGVGAIIGAIAGGGKGAAIGAIIGGGAGAGSVIVQGKDDLQLRAGSTVTIQASSPNR